MNARAQMLNFHFGSIFNLRYIVGFLSYKHDSKNKNDQQTLIISNLIIFLARAFISPSYSKNDIFSHFRSMQQHVSKFLRAQVRARVYSSRQSTRMQKLNIFHIYIVLITSKLRTFEPPWTQHVDSWLFRSIILKKRQKWCSAVIPKKDSKHFTSQNTRYNILKSENISLKPVLSEHVATLGNLISIRSVKRKL